VDDLDSELNRWLTSLANDRQSGATAILGDAIRVLSAALAAARPIPPLARAICHAQPSMASLWNAAVAAIAASQQPERFERFVQRVARSQAALARFAGEHFGGGTAGDSLRLVTLSNSGSVWTVIDAVRQQRTVHVACSESRPAAEGLGLARRLTAAGVPVTVFGDAAIAHALSVCDAVLVGADAVSPEWFLNKSGTRMLAAAAAQQGVPVYVAATRDKFMAPQIAARLRIREGPPEEIWNSAPAGIEVRNPYFERTTLDVVTAVISDAGVLGVGMVPEVCAAMSDEAMVEALAEMDR
jgi:translation initiation factor 2B subunit (eIF-2B alpha/beta/delta family)